MLTNQKGLAKVSATPGKTQLINHFLINDQWYMVDLPGYGYARVSKDQRKGFSTMITKYILEREPMTFLFLLVDSRHEPQKIDLEFIQFLGENSVPFGIVFTKCDKLSQNKVESGVALYRRVLKKTWDELPIMFLTSSEKKMGKEALLEFVESCLENANQ